MYVDKELLLSDSQTISATCLSSNYIDLSSAKNLSKGKQMYVIVVVDTVFGTSDSVNFQVVTDSDIAMNSVTVQMETGVITIDKLTANRAPIVIPIGSALGTEEQYLALQYTVGGSAGTGACTAFVGFDIP